MISISKLELSRPACGRVRVPGKEGAEVKRAVNVSRASEVAAYAHSNFAVCGLLSYHQPHSTQANRMESQKTHRRK